MNEHETINPLAAGDAHQQWIQDAWPQLGVIAARHFMQDGRGFILLNMIEADILNKDTALVNVQYVAETTKLFQQCRAALRDGSPEAEAGLIENVSQYDPAREIVLVVCLPDRAVTYRCNFEDKAPTPAQSFSVALLQAVFPVVDVSQN
jgi:hypothetical protein